MATTSMTKVVKVPVLIPDKDKEHRLLKYKALDKGMLEAQFLGNLAIRYAIALTLKGISRELDPAKGKPVVLDTPIYRILAEKRIYLNAATVATLGMKLRTEDTGGCQPLRMGRAQETAHVLFPFPSSPQSGHDDPGVRNEPADPVRQPFRHGQTVAAG